MAGLLLLLSLSQVNTHQSRRSQNMTEESPFERLARFYDDDYRDYHDDLALILSLAQEANGPVLELGCGTGRIMAPLIVNGCPVTGVDNSPALLAVARSKLTGQPSGARWQLVEGDLRDVNLDVQDFRFAFCTSNTLMHLTSQSDQLQALKNTHRHLAEGALLMLDLFNPDPARWLAVDGLQELADRWTDPATGAQVLKWSIRAFDLAEQLQETLFIYEEIFADGEVKRTLCPFTLRFLWRSEAELMLRHAGFQVEDVLGNFDGEPYHGASERLILLARK
jgi:SAM-dependent methyltransferase